MLVALRRLPNLELEVSDDDGLVVNLTLAEWRTVLRLPTGKQRAAVEAIVADREKENTE